MNTRPMHLLLLFPLLLLSQACGGGARAWEGTVTDSAGIAVVHNTATPIWSSGSEWTVTEELRIGSIAGELEYQFGQIFPVGSIDIDPAGNIYVMDSQAQEARVFDSEGGYLRTLGGPGSGPGEFSAQAFFLFTDDAGRVYVPDLGNQRVTMFGSTGEPLGSFPIQIQAGLPARWKVDNAGRVIAQLRGLNAAGIQALDDGDPLVVYDTTGAVVDTVALLPKGETIQEISEGQVSMLMFAPEPVWDIDDSGIVFYGMNNEYRILVKDPNGDLIRIITYPAEPKAVGERDKAGILSFLRGQVEAAGAPPPAVEQFLQGVAFAENYPAFSQIIVGPSNTLWIQRIRSAEDMIEGAEEEAELDLQNLGSPKWDIFDDQGRYLGLVTVPDGFAPVVAVGNHIYGVWADELDVQYVMRLRVNIPG